jgi:hypothetical protein
VDILFEVRLRRYGIDAHGGATPAALSWPPSCPLRCWLT